MGRLFGTDGIRGVVNETLTCELAMRIGRAAASVLCDGRRRRSIFVIGTDTRISSDMLSSALTAGLCSVGADVILLGVVPTPAVAYLVEKYKADAGIMISASHNPALYNGIKIFSGDGYKLPDALEEQIEAIVLDDASMPPPCDGREVGRVTRGTGAVKDYVEHIKSTCPYSLSGLHIAVDCANGSASVTAKRLFSDLGADVRMLFDKPDGMNINDGCGSTHMEALTDYVVKYLDKDTNEPVADEKTESGLEVGTSVTETAIPVGGYAALDPTEATLVLAESGNEIIFYYQKLTTYTIHYCDAFSGEDIAEPKTVTDVPVGETYTEYALDILGYTPLDNEITFTLMESGNDYYFYYVKSGWD